MGHGGSRPGSGRKKGSGISNKIKKAVDQMMGDLLSDDEVLEYAKREQAKVDLCQGWVYVIKDNETGLVKTGVTQRQNPKKRLSQYYSHNMDIELLYLCWIDFCYDVESVIHELFESNRKGNGDWFNLNKSQVLSLITEINKQKYTDYYG